MIRWLLGGLLLLSGLLAGCQNLQSLNLKGSQAEPLYVSCLTWYVKMDRMIRKEGVSDAQYYPIPGLPYLRTNRFLSSFDPQKLGSDLYRHWFQILQENDQEARQIEWQNLPVSLRRTLKPPVDGDSRDTIRRCGKILGRSSVTDPRVKKHLSHSYQVPDQYSTFKRLFGLYPVTALFFRRGIDHWHEKVRRGYKRPLPAVPVKGALVRYRPPDVLPQAFISASITDPVFSSLSQTQWRALFDYFAPIWEVDTTSDNDRIGRPEWGSRQIRIDTSRPEIYYLPSLTRLNEQTLLQLNYVAWFPARPKTGALDLLGGHLDGLIFRVTLNQAGKILAYDSIHACGCYYMLFPRHVKPVKKKGWSEPVLMPQQAPIPGANERLVIRLSHRDHQIQRLYVDNLASDENQYALIPYQQLRSLPLNKASEQTGFRSMFDAKGLVRGSQRLERWFFWPMGIRSPGAMRQWGTHAIAFVGKRHFDDARLLESYMPTD